MVILGAWPGFRGFVLRAARNHLCGLWDLVPISLLPAAQGCGCQMRAPVTPLSFQGLRAAAAARGVHPPPQHPQRHHQNTQHGPGSVPYTPRRFILSCMWIRPFPSTFRSVLKHQPKRIQTPSHFCIYLCNSCSQPDATRRKKNRGLRVGEPESSRRHLPWPQFPQMWVQDGVLVGHPSCLFLASRFLPILHPPRGTASSFSWGSISFVCDATSIKAEALLFLLFFMFLGTLGRQKHFYDSSNQTT